MMEHRQDSNLLDILFFLKQDHIRKTRHERFSRIFLDKWETLRHL